MQLVTIRQTLHRNQFLAIERWQELDAGIDCFDADFTTIAREFRDNNGASATVTLGTTFFCAFAVGTYAKNKSASASRYPKFFILLTI